MGAGYAGLSAARALSKNNLHDFKILEATAHVGGRTRNIDARDLRMDTTSDHVLEMGGTFVSPGHTALIELADSLGFPVFNATPSRTLKFEPAGTWPWWWFGVDTQSSMLPSTLYSEKGVASFSTPEELERAFDEEAWAQLEAAGEAMTQLVASVNCSTPGTQWDAADAGTFESWIRASVQNEEARSALRSMCRGMIAQEPSSVSLLFTVRSLKGCWSAGDDDQYRIRGGTQGPLLALADAFGDRVALEEEVVAVTQMPGGRWKVESRSGTVLVAKHVVVTGPPAVVAKIRIPSLAPVTRQLLQRMPMGTSLKYFLVYENAFWRTDLGHSGQVVATAALQGDLFSACEEHSPYAGVVGANGSGALLCWIEGECNLRFDALSDEERKRKVTSLFAGAMRNDSRLWTPTHVIAHDWKKEAFAEGAYTSYFPPGVQSEPEFWLESTKAEKRPGLFFAGSDYQVGYGAGYIEGAVRMGQDVAATILGRLG